MEGIHQLGAAFRKAQLRIAASPPPWPCMRHFEVFQNTNRSKSDTCIFSFITIVTGAFDYSIYVCFSVNLSYLVRSHQLRLLIWLSTSSTMNFPSAEEVCWTEKETVVKQENEDAVAVTKVESDILKKEEDYVAVKEEDTVKDEKYETTDMVFVLKAKEEEEGCLIDIEPSPPSHSPRVSHSREPSPPSHSPRVSHRREPSPPSHSPRVSHRRASPHRRRHGPYNRFQTKVLMNLEKIIENQEEILLNQRMLLAGVEVLPEEVIPRSCRTVEELEDLCKGLEDATKRNKMINYLQSVGGGDLGTTVRKYLNKIASNQVLRVYSLKGRKGKRCFQDLNICWVITRACQLNFKVKETDVEDMIAATLKMAPFLPREKKQTDSFIHGQQCQPRRAPASSSGGAGVRCLAYEHLNTSSGEPGDQTTNRPVARQST